MAAPKKIIACFRVIEAESERLNAFVEAQGRTNTDVIREFIRSLPEPPKKKPRRK